MTGQDPLTLTWNQTFRVEPQPGTQLRKVWVMLYLGPVCGTQFLDAHIPRYGARIHDLKKLGWEVQKRRCVNPQHAHRSVQWEWWID